jgi:hypothetical protein
MRQIGLKVGDFQFYISDEELEKRSGKARPSGCVAALNAYRLSTPVVRRMNTTSSAEKGEPVATAKQMQASR